MFWMYVPKINQLEDQAVLLAYMHAYGRPVLIEERGRQRGGGDRALDARTQVAR